MWNARGEIKIHKTNMRRFKKGKSDKREKWKWTKKIRKQRRRERKWKPDERRKRSEQEKEQ